MERGNFAKRQLGPSIENVDQFKQSRARAYDKLNESETALQVYGDTHDLIGESIVDRHHRDRMAVRALTNVGIQNGWLSKELEEV